MAERSTTAEDRRTARSSKSSSSRPQTRRDSTVLLIDADDDFRTALADALRDDGHQVVELRSTIDLPPLSQLRHNSALIIGIEGEREIPFCDRFHQAHPTVPVVLITPYRTSTLDREAAKREDFLAVVCKPVNYEELQALIRPNDGSSSKAVRPA